MANELEERLAEIRAEIEQQDEEWRRARRAPRNSETRADRDPLRLAQEGSSEAFDHSTPFAARTRARSRVERAFSTDLASKDQEACPVE